MGGCCCCFSSRRSEPVRAPTYYYAWLETVRLTSPDSQKFLNVLHILWIQPQAGLDYLNHCPRTSEERQPLSAHRDAPSGSSAGLLVDTNLDTSIPDTYTPPPLPVPFDINPGPLQSSTPLGDGINYVTKSEIAGARPDAGSTDVPNSTDSPENPEKNIDGKEQSILELTPSKDSEDDLKKPVNSVTVTIEEEDCPICLEEYTEENPKMLTKCEHHFHLCCILEWLERSDSCPVCDQEVVIDDSINS